MEERRPRAGRFASSDSVFGDGGDGEPYHRKQKTLLIGPGGAMRNKVEVNVYCESLLAQFSSIQASSHQESRV
jgi:hypothetical protein